MKSYGLTLKAHIVICSEWMIGAVILAAPKKEVKFGKRYKREIKEKIVNLYQEKGRMNKNYTEEYGAPQSGISREREESQTKDQFTPEGQLVWGLIQKIYRLQREEELMTEDKNIQIKQELKRECDHAQKELELKMENERLLDEIKTMKIRLRNQKIKAIQRAIRHLEKENDLLEKNIRLLKALERRRFFRNLFKH